MDSKQRLEYLKRLKPGKLAAMCPVKPTLPPAAFNWERRWTTVYPRNCKGMSVAQFLAVDAHADAFEHLPRLDALKKPGRWAREYVRAWDKAKHLKPCTSWVKVEASYG